MQIFVVLACVVRNHSSIRHHDLQIGRIHPDAPQKVALVLYNLLWPHVEDVAVDLVDLLPPHVLCVVLRNLLRRQHKRIALLNVLQVRWRHHHALQRAFRRVNRLLHAPPRRIENDIVHLVPLAIHLVVSSSIVCTRASRR